MSTVPSARAGASSSEPSAQTHSENVYFLAINDQYESAIAKAYIAQKYPASKARFRTELKLQRLSEKHVVIALVRGEDRSPLERTARDDRGIAHIVRTSPGDLTREIRECKPIKVADHWRRSHGADEYDDDDGEIDVESFMTELGKQATPICPRTHIGTPDLLKLTFV